LYFATNFSAALGKTIHSVSKTSMEALETYDWPGNVQSVAPRAKGVLKWDLEDVERTRIVRVLEESNWKVKGDGNAADRLGLSPSTLRSRMKRLDITRP